MEKQDIESILKAEGMYFHPLRLIANMKTSNLTRLTREIKRLKKSQEIKSWQKQTENVIGKDPGVFGSNPKLIRSHSKFTGSLNLKQEGSCNEPKRKSSKANQRRFISHL